MENFERKLEITGTAFSFFLLILFVTWQEFNPRLLYILSKEDRLIESLSAIFFGLSSLCFFIVAYRSDFLQQKSGPRYFMTLSWALLMFVFMGEEISWGQRIFGLTTPDALREINLQGETNIHNIEFVDTFLGGKYRYLSVMMLTTGLLLPLFALSQTGKQLLQRFAFPVSPLCLAPLFVGAYVYGKYYHPQMGNDASEVREFLMSAGMLCFALAGAIYPCTLFRVCDDE